MQASEITNNLADKKVEGTAEIASSQSARPPLKREALHLEYPTAEMARELPEGEAAEAEFIMLRQKWPRLRQEYYKQKISELGLSRKEIGNRAEKIRLAQGTKGFNRNKFFSRFDGFFEPRDFWAPDTDQLIRQILDISAEEVPDLTPDEKARIPLLKERIELPFKLFVENYPLIKKYSRGIYNSEELSNIYVYKPIWLGRYSGATLGKLLTLSNLYGTCEYCGGRTLIYTTESRFISKWRSTPYTCRICLKCQRKYSTEFRDDEFRDSFVLYDDVYQRIATRWTMLALTKAVQRLERLGK